jgi:hypothetical protein
MHGKCTRGFARPGASPTTSAARSMPADEPLPIHSGVLVKSYRFSGLPSKRSSLVHARKIAPKSMRMAFATADRRLDFSSNPGLSLHVRSRSNRRNCSAARF